MIEHYNGQYQEIFDLFNAAVHETALGAYTIEQVHAWAPLKCEPELWKWRCELKRPFLYVQDNIIIGFAEFDSDGHVDCLYTHPRHNRKGVGSALLEHLLKVAARNGIKRVYVEASHVAKGLFLKHGFQVVRENHIEVRGCELSNWIMERIEGSE